MNYYGEFEYKKVLAIMFQLADRVNTPENMDNGYLLKITPFEDYSKNDLCFNSSSLIESESFENLSIFSLLYVEFYMDSEIHSPSFVFLMGESECRIDLLLNYDREKNKEFSNLFPHDESKLSNWRFAVSLFISRINTITSHKIKVEELITEE